MTWCTQLTLALALALPVACEVASCSTSCSGNWKSNECNNRFNFHQGTCKIKSDDCTIRNNRTGKPYLTPGPFELCNGRGQASGCLSVDGYTLAMQNGTFAGGAATWTLHGLWAESRYGNGSHNQPYGCKNGEEFDKTILKNFSSLLGHFWPTNQTDSSEECFILSEWMKHGTCAVIPGRDGTAFRLSQETYFRTALVIANELNANATLRRLLNVTDPMPPHGTESIIKAQCVQCAYRATVDWTGYDVASVPRMSHDCIDQCVMCDKYWHTCHAANLTSTVQLDPSNAPLRAAADLVQSDEL